MGSDGTQKFASSSTSSAMYCNNKNIEPPKITCYWNRYKQPYVKHEFSLQLDNTQDGCPADDVMDAEIWVNELYAFDVGQCTHAYATINGLSNTISTYQHNKLCWGWEENIMLEVAYTCLPYQLMSCGTSKQSN